MMLTDLPAETRLQIFENLDDLEDLLSLMLTNKKHFYELFNEYPIQILQAVLVNAIGPVALPHALAIVHFSANSPAPALCNCHSALLGHPWNEDDDDDSDVSDDDDEGVRCTGPSEPLKLNKMPGDLGSLINMARAHNYVSRFTRSYSRQALLDIEFNALRVLHLKANRMPQDWFTLSQTERQRFYRAFYRWDLYSRIAIATWYNELPDDHIAYELQRYHVLGGSSHSENKVELLAIHDFFHGIAQTHLCEVYTMWMDEIRASHSVLEQHTDSDSFLQSSILGYTFDYERKKHLSSWIDYEHWQEEHYASWLATQPLEFLSRLESANDATRKAIHAEIAQNFEGRLVADELMFLVGVIQDAEDKDEEDEDEDDDEVWDYEDIALHSYHKRSLALPFWDAERMHDTMVAAVVKDCNTRHGKVWHMAKNLRASRW